tara:strand:+ start:453 stop:644 length:192 start_codon:yes stop_codon:yes gene_type:complete
MIFLPTFRDKVGSLIKTIDQNDGKINDFIKTEYASVYATSRVVAPGGKLWISTASQTAVLENS